MHFSFVVIVVCSANYTSEWCRYI